MHYSLRFHGTIPNRSRQDMLTSQSGYNIFGVSENLDFRFRNRKITHRNFTVTIIAGSVNSYSFSIILFVDFIY